MRAPWIEGLVFAVILAVQSARLFSLITYEFLAPPTVPKTFLKVHSLLLRAVKF